jgi:RNA polymerase sigma factor (sigma-70 family)
MVRPSFKRAPGPPDLSCADDAALVLLFVEAKEEPAFAELVRRHGPMVLQVCRRALSSRQDAEDAFQLTFLVLAKKAPQLHQPQLVGNWLYGVAVNVSRRARAAASRRRAAEAQMLRSSVAARDSELHSDSSHVRHLIDLEVQRLPAKYRAAIVACYVEGRTNRDAARILGWPLGTLVTRLNRAKSSLRTRVANRLKKENDTALKAALDRRAAPMAIPFALLVSTLKMAKKVYSPPPIPMPTARINSLPVSTSAQARVVASKLQISGVSAFSIALTVLGTCLALGAAIHHNAPVPPHSEDRAESEAARPQSPPQRSTPRSPAVGPAANARTIAAALTEANRDALVKSAPPPRANVR